MHSGGAQDHAAANVRPDSRLLGREGEGPWPGTPAGDAAAVDLPPAPRMNVGKKVLDTKFA